MSVTKTNVQMAFWRKSVLASVLCALLWGSFLSVMPRPAQAFEMVNDSANQATDMSTYADKLVELLNQLTLLGEIINVVTTLTSSITDLFGELTDEQSKRDKVLLQGEEAITEVRERVAQAISDNHALDTKRQVMMEIAARNAPPPHEYLCKAQLAHMIAPTTERFEYAVQRLAEKALESMYRGPYDNGMGAQYFADEYRLRCYNKTASPVDGYPAECIDTVTGLDKEPARRTFVDADLSPFTLDGAVTLEIPVMETKAVQISSGHYVTVVVPKPENYNQKMWVAGLNYCFELAGPRPTPLWGKQMKTDVGKRDRAMFSRGLAIQSAAFKNCTQLLAYHTRPNASMTELRAKQNRDCSVVKGAGGSGDGIFSAETIKTQFDNCENGLSPYQAEALSAMLCKSPNHYLAQGLAGGKHYSQMAGIVRCSIGWNTWRGTVVQRDGSLVRSVTGLIEAKKVWSQMAGARLSSLGEPTGYEYVADMLRDPSAAPIQTVKADEPAVKPRLREDVKGVPVFSDEIPLPQSVAQ